MSDLTLNTIQIFFTSLISDVVLLVATVLTSTSLLALGIILVDFARRTLIGGRTSWLSSNFKYRGNYVLDHTPFVKPYKNYNRFRSMNWNMKHTM